MANQYGLFWNSVSGDRTYNADDFAEWLGKFFTTGVFNGDLQVVPDSGMTVNVNTGYANLQGKVRFFDTVESFTLDPASGTYPRIDTIVVRANATNREITLEYVTGDYSGLDPEPKAPTRAGGIYEIVLAEILVAAGAISIDAADITDKRPDDTVCGWVTGTVDSVDVDQLTTQAQAQFDAWFAHMRDQLSEDAAGNLQLQIDAINDSILKQATAIIYSNGWSNSTTQVNGVEYYTYTVQLDDVFVESPVISIGATDTLPTEAEQEAYDTWQYATVDDSTKELTLYSEEVPANSFVIIVHDATI